MTSITGNVEIKVDQKAKSLHKILIYSRGKVFYHSLRGSGCHTSPRFPIWCMNERLQIISLSQAVWPGLPNSRNMSYTSLVQTPLGFSKNL